MDQFDQGMSERLRRVDPVTDSAYHHRDLNAMLARVTATPRVEKVRWAQGFRLRMGSAAAAAALLTAGGIGALQTAAPSLSFALAGNARVGASTSAVPKSVGGVPFGANDLMRLGANYQFVAGPDLTTSSGTAEAYGLSEPSDLTAASEQLAQLFGVTGTPDAAPADNSGWNISAGAANVYFYADGGVLSWNYNADNVASAVTPVSPPSSTDGSAPIATSTTPTDDTATPPSNDQLLTWAATYEDELGVTSELTDPSFGQGSVSDGNTTTDENSVSFTWSPDGIGTQYEFNFTFDDSGDLLAANGVDGTLNDLGVVPIVSETTAVSTLQSQWNSEFVAPSSPVTQTTTDPNDASTGTDNTSGSGDATGSTGSLPPSTDTTPTTTTTLPTTTVTLDSATLTYGEYTLTSGAVVLLPQYQFNDGWTVLAVDPSVVSVQGGAGFARPLY
jgi:hypothetical protein